MKKPQRTLLLVLAGAIVFCGIVSVSLAAWFFLAVFDTATIEQTAASRSFDEVRQRFAAVAPVFEIRGDETVVTRRPDAGQSRQPLNTLHLLVWEAEDQGMIRVEMPFWLLRLKKDPFDVSVDAAEFTGRFDFTAEDIERYGPTLLVDHIGRRGDRLLVWTD